MPTLKEQIMAVNADPLLSKEEKNRMIQQLMNPGLPAGQPKPPPAPCPHYEKSCSRFFFSCCQAYDECVRCHKEGHPDCQAPKVVTVVCNACELEQVPAAACSGCEATFSKSFCGICFIFTAKDIVHCVDCGLCRIGLPGELFHCTTCNMCFFIKDRDAHTCMASRRTQMQCCMCLESTFDSFQQQSYFTNCGHAIHAGCMESARKNGMYKCGLCRKSILNMADVWLMMSHEVAFQPMPDEYKRFQVGDKAKTKFGILTVEAIEGGMISGRLDWASTARGTFRIEDVTQLVNVYCNDCDGKSSTPFHFVGNQCQPCGSFNTSILGAN